MGKGTQSKGDHHETLPTMKLPVSGTRTNSASERCCAAVKEQPWRVTQAPTGAAHHQPGCSWLRGGGSNLLLLTCPWPPMAAPVSKGVFTF